MAELALPPGELAAIGAAPFYTSGPSPLERLLARSRFTGRSSDATRRLWKQRGKPLLGPLSLVSGVPLWWGVWLR